MTWCYTLIKKLKIKVRSHVFSETSGWGQNVNSVTLIVALVFLKLLISKQNSFWSLTIMLQMSSSCAWVREKWVNQIQQLWNHRLCQDAKHLTPHLTSTEENDVGLHCCQPKTEMWNYSGHRLSKTRQTGQSDQTQFLLRLKMVGSENLASSTWIYGPNLACVNSCCSHSFYFKGQSLFEYCCWPCASSKGCPQYDDASCLKLLLWTWERVKWTSVASVSDSSLSQLLWDVVTQQ